MILRPEEQNFLLKCIQVLLGVVVGFISGAALPTYIGGFWAWSTGPHQHGLFAIFIPLATVIGAFVGLFVGPTLAIGYPKWFYRFWIPFALLAVAQNAFWRWMRSLERPRDFVIELQEPVGAEFAALSLADGVEAKHQLKLPATLQFHSREVRFACALVNPDHGQKVRFEVLCQGKTKVTDIIAPPIDVKEYAFEIRLFSFGYSDHWGFGGSSVGGGILPESEIQPLIKQFQRPAHWDKQGNR